MRKVFVLAALLVFVSGVAMAQDQPKAEVFGGYSFLRVNPGGGISGENFPAGWHASIAGNVAATGAAQVDTELLQLNPQHLAHVAGRSRQCDSGHRRRAEHSRQDGAGQLKNSSSEACGESSIRQLRQPSPGECRDIPHLHR